MLEGHAVRQRESNLGAEAEEADADHLTDDQRAENHPRHAIHGGKLDTCVRKGEEEQPEVHRELEVVLKVVKRAVVVFVVAGLVFLICFVLGREHARVA